MHSSARRSKQSEVQRIDEWQWCMPVSPELLCQLMYVWTSTGPRSIPYCCLQKQRWQKMVQRQNDSTSDSRIFGQALR